MFCLRSWVPLLIFLTNASPLYVLLFLTATYALQRPCVYCSILLFVLIFSLFDFHADWFEPRWNASDLSTFASQTMSSLMSGNSTVSDAILETASLAVSAANGTGGSLASAAVEGIKRKAGAETNAVVGAAVGSSGSGGVGEEAVPDTLRGCDRAFVGHWHGKEFFKGRIVGCIHVCGFVGIIAILLGHNLMIYTVARHTRRGGGCGGC